MLLVGLLTSFVSAITGVGAQAAAAPMIEFLLGFNAERTKGTAIAFTLFASSAAAFGAIYSGVHVEFSEAFLVAIGAFVGAVITVKASLDPNLKSLRRFGQGIGILLTLYIITEAFKHRAGGPQTLILGSLSDSRALLALSIGLFSGSLSQLFHVASGIFLFPALMYTRGHSLHPITEAVAISLTVIALASFLPAIAHSTRKAVDQSIGPYMVAGGVIGGFLGGMLLGHLAIGSVVPLIMFGLVGMYLCSLTLYRMN